MAEVISMTQSSEQPNNIPVAEAVTNQNPQPNIPENEAEKKPHESIPEELKQKNRLQEFTQRASLPLPMYHTVNEGPQHAPLFRSSVLVDGVWYTSPTTFTQVKAAEHYVAKLALSGVKAKMNQEGCPLIREDTVFCKSILNEYAAKMNLERPTYNTVQPEGLLPVFKSTVVFNGVHYTGATGKNKKEAEQLAARAAVMSILETESGTMILEIIKSKRKLYAALDKVQDTGNFSAASFMPMEHPGNEIVSPVHVDKRIKVDATNVAGQNAYTGAVAYSLGQPSNVPHHPHVFQRTNVGPSSVEVVPPIVFVPAVLNPSSITSTSGKKRNRRNKKKAKQNVQVDSQVPDAMLPSTVVPACSVA